tara:strand:- start:142 stop:621 length:480 start_codon:yes stop_codon:yes gene_type:complete
LINFLNTFIKLSKKVYKELGGYEERFIQMALAVELRENKIDFLRETNIELFYKNHALGLGELDFLIYPCMDLRETIMIETKVASKLTDSHRQQLKNYLVSAPSNINKSLGSVKKGILINYKNVEEYSDGKYTTPEDGVTFEIWELKGNKFSNITLKYPI